MVEMFLLRDTRDGYNRYVWVTLERKFFDNFFGFNVNGHLLLSTVEPRYTEVRYTEFHVIPKQASPPRFLIFKIYSLYRILIVKSLYTVTEVQRWILYCY
jgi:hypothetical protein